MRKKRAVLLGTNAYPFLMCYWFELFKRFWQDEVDRVYIAVSKAEHASTWRYIKQMLESHPKIKVFETNRNWPLSINKVALAIEEDLIFIPHDDTLIYKSGVLDMYFNMLEKDDRVITPITPIFTPKELVEELMHRRFPTQVPFTGETTKSTGYSFYCNFFFLTREQLHKTGINFGHYEKQIGEYCENLEWTPLSQPFRADTNFLLCLQLLSAGCKFTAIEKQEFATVYNDEDPLQRLRDMRDKKEIPFTNVGWVHLQSMAYGIYDLYYDLGEKERLEAQIGDYIFPKIHSRGAERISKPAMWSYTIRMAWIIEFMHYSQDEGLRDYWKHAIHELKYIMVYFDIPIKTILECRDIFHQLIWKQ